MMFVYVLSPESDYALFCNEKIRQGFYPYLAESYLMHINFRRRRYYYV